MAVIMKMTDEAKKEILSQLPEKVKPVFNAYPPNRLYMHRPTQRRVIITGYNEDGETVTVFLSGQFNVLLAERSMEVQVKDLEECDPPSEDAPRGLIVNDLHRIELVFEELLIKAMKGEIDPDKDLLAIAISSCTGTGMVH